MIKRHENIRLPLAEQDPQRDRVSRNETRLNGWPIWFAFFSTAGTMALRASVLMKANRRAPELLLPTWISPPLIWIDLPVVVTMFRFLPRNGKTPPSIKVVRSGSLDSCARSHCSCSVANPVASFIEARAGSVSVACPSVLEMRSVNRFARGLRLRRTSIRGDPMNIWSLNLLLLCGGWQ